MVNRNSNLQTASWNSILAQPFSFLPQRFTTANFNSVCQQMWSCRTQSHHPRAWAAARTFCDVGTLWYNTKFDFLYCLHVRLTRGYARTNFSFNQLLITRTLQGILTHTLARKASVYWWKTKHSYTHYTWVSGAWRWVWWHDIVTSYIRAELERCKCERHASCFSDVTHKLTLISSLSTSMYL